MAASSTNSAGGDFVVDDCFVDDDLLTPGDYEDGTVLRHGLQSQKSFLERDNFENELGSSNEDPFGEDFGEIAGHDIIDVFGEGDLVARPVIVIYAYRFPSNKTFDHEKFLRFVQYTLDKLVDMDYTIVYFHYGLRSNNKPPLKWLINTYQMLDRRFKKNLKALYLVHPTKFIRFIWRIFQPIISLKFEQKVHYINSLEELNVLISTVHLNIPQPITDYDKSAVKTSLITNHRLGQPQTHSEISPPRPTQQFNVPLKFILNHHPNSDIPPIATELIDFITQYGLKQEGIFRRSATISSIKSLQERINRGERIDYINDPVFKGDLQNSVIHAAVLLKTFLRSLEEPLITNRLYPELTLLNGIEKSKRIEAIREFLQKLPPENYLLLRKIAQFLVIVSDHSEENLMNINNLSVVFGPNLTWPTDRQVPMSQMNHLNNFCYNLIKHFNEIFTDNYT